MTQNKAVYDKKPLKLRPYGAIQICLLLLLFFYTPGSIDPGVKNYKLEANISGG